MKKAKIFQALDKKFIQNLFKRKKKLFFPFKKAGISNIEIKRTSPDWAKETCLVRYKILFDDKTQKIIRGSSKTRKPKKSNWEIMQYLYNHGFAGGNLRIRKPIGYIQNINLLLYEEVAGVTLTEIIDKKNQIIITRTLRNVAKWLAKLHSLKPDCKKLPLAPFIKLKGYKNIFRKIRKYIPELKNDIILTDKLSFIDQLWREKKDLIHNDFYPGNSIVNKNTIYGIDFDRAGLGPYLMDVATLYGALEFPKEIWNLNIPKEQIINFQKIFLLEYCKLRKLDYLKVKNDLKKFLVKIFLDRIYDYAKFAFEGWEKWDHLTKTDTTIKLRKIFQKINFLLHQL